MELSSLKKYFKPAYIETSTLQQNTAIAEAVSLRNYL